MPPNAFAAVLSAIVRRLYHEFIWSAAETLVSILWLPLAASLCYHPEMAKDYLPEDEYPFVVLLGTAMASFVFGIGIGVFITRQVYSGTATTPAGGALPAGQAANWLTRNVFTQPHGTASDLTIPSTPDGFLSAMRLTCTQWLALTRQQRLNAARPFVPSLPGIRIEQAVSWLVLAIDNHCLAIAYQQIAHGT